MKNGKPFPAPREELHIMSCHVKEGMHFRLGSQWYEIQMVLLLEHSTQIAFAPVGDPKATATLFIDPTHVMDVTIPA